MRAFQSGIDFLEFLRTRRSVRRFLSDPAPPEILTRLLEAATWAPSAHNRQPWRFVVLENHAARQRLADAMGDDLFRDLISDGIEAKEAERQVTRSRERITSAPAAILLCLDTSSGDPYPDSRRQRAEYIMGVQSVALAGGMLLLAAHAEGLGAVWVCAPLFTPARVQEVLDLPVSWEPQALILLGTPASKPQFRPRHAIEDVAYFIR
jgi:F420 biosynthesis protein FbiB-like protein